MFSRKQPRSAARHGASRRPKHETIRGGSAPVLASLLLLLLALAAPALIAASNSGTDTNGSANPAGSLASDARATTSPAPTEASGASSPAESVAPPIFAATDFPPPVIDLLTAPLETDSRAAHPARSRPCVLPQTLYRPLKNRPVVLLGTFQAAALVSDGITTRQFLRRGYTEVDPVARFFIGSRPTWGRMAPLGTLQVFAGMWIAERMATSRHPWIRRFWWLPQTMGIAGNVAGTGNNLTLH